MTKAEKDNILKIAKNIRLELEGLANKYPSYYRTDLCGLCAIGSMKLHNILKKHKIKSELHYNLNHVFIVTNGYILDVTATQFEFKKKVIFRKYSGKLSYYWHNRQIYKTPKELKLRLINDCWSNEQVEVPTWNC